MKNIHKIIESPTEIVDKCSWWYNTITKELLRWDGTEWDKLSMLIDLTPYLTIASASSTYETKVDANTTKTTVLEHTQSITDLQTQTSALETSVGDLEIAAPTYLTKIEAVSLYVPLNTFNPIAT